MHIMPLRLIIWALSSLGNNMIFPSTVPVHTAGKLDTVLGLAVDHHNHFSRVHCFPSDHCSVERFTLDTAIRHSRGNALSIEDDRLLW